MLDGGKLSSITELLYVSIQALLTLLVKNTSVLHNQLCSDPIASTDMGV